MLTTADIYEELNEYEWRRARWTSDKLIAASPFRHDDRPSFFVNLNTGGWHDSGAIDPEWQSGNFAALLGYLRGTNEAEAYDYLQIRYGSDNGDNTYVTPKIKPIRLPVPKPYKPLDDSLLIPYKFRHPYLGRRGISENVQRLMRIGYDKRSRAVTIPWFNPAGTLGNIMYRQVNGKSFWYARGGRPISEMIYGIDIIYSRRIRRASIVEAPIDAMTVMTAGYAAVAVGGTAFSEAKRDLLIRSPIEELTIIRDNDAAGRVLQRRIIEELSPYMTVKIAVIPKKYGKDVNDCAVNAGASTVLECILRGREAKKKNYFRKVCKIGEYETSRYIRPKNREC